LYVKIACFKNHSKSSHKQELLILLLIQHVSAR